MYTVNINFNYYRKIMSLFDVQLQLYPFVHDPFIDD